MKTKKIKTITIEIVDIYDENGNLDNTESLLSSIKKWLKKVTLEDWEIKHEIGDDLPYYEELNDDYYKNFK